MGPGTCLPGNSCQLAAGSFTYSCAACGGKGLACCAGNICTTGMCKVGGTCP
ncbi:MAG TPA: hypothetical protein VF518_10555 [Polyangia bacterium]